LIVEVQIHTTVVGEPHWWPQGTGHGQKVTDLNEAEIEEYLAGYDYNEQPWRQKVVGLTKKGPFVIIVL
jgi:hypothetical protein